MTLDGTSYVFLGVSGVLLTPVSGPAESLQTFLFTRRRIRAPDAIRAALERALGARAADTATSPPWSSIDHESAMRLFRELALDDEAEALVRDLCDPDGVHGRWALAPGAVAGLELLRRHGIRTGVLSAVGETLRDTLEALEILSYFNYVLPVPESPSERRDAEQLGEILDELGVSPSGAWFIGTGPDPVLARARRAGLDTLELSTGVAESGGPAPGGRLDEAVHHLIDEDP
jgi:phosphoglycolate phosphatase-like HAD superfamily hydrolase